MKEIDIRTLMDNYVNSVKAIDKLYSNNLELINRIEKAIEYIENDLQSFLYSIEYKTLLEILKGGK